MGGGMQREVLEWLGRSGVGVFAVHYVRHRHVITEEGAEGRSKRIRRIAHLAFVLGPTPFRHAETSPATVTAMSDVISIETLGAIATITIDRAPVNALTAEHWTELRDVIAMTADNHELRAVVVAGENQSFCAGADIRTLTEPHADMDEAEMLLVVADAANAIRQHRAPVIAAIDGPAHGGGLELALACDIRIASPRATFAAAGINMGLIASVSSLIDAIGDTRARRMLLTGYRITAADASLWGLVTDVDDAPLDAAMAVASAIATKPPLAVEATKYAVAQRPRLSPAEHSDLMGELFRFLATSDDHAEAIRAFLEKRRGNYGRR
ncbi:MAG: enoyl-CoA hydratase/isomerase family protein [Acidimicrobiales bacterium]|nr:MAG: enoyl-CoA hydratase/isomerase family protein [Acidimicrobiales bacterium]